MESSQRGTATGSPRGGRGAKKVLAVPVSECGVDEASRCLRLDGEGGACGEVVEPGSAESRCMILKNDALSVQLIL